MQIFFHFYEFKKVNLQTVLIRNFVLPRRIKIHVQNLNNEETRTFQSTLLVL